MHYYALVVIPGDGDTEQLVGEAMAPHSMDTHDLGIWDWWQIGGREWRSFDGDVTPVWNVDDFMFNLAAEHLPFTVLAHGSDQQPIARERWNGHETETVHDDHGIRDGLELILRARSKAGLTSRVVVVD